MVNSGDMIIQFFVAVACILSVASGYRGSDCSCNVTESGMTDVCSLVTRAIKTVDRIEGKLKLYLKNKYDEEISPLINNQERPKMQNKIQDEMRDTDETWIKEIDPMVEDLKVQERLNIYRRLYDLEIKSYRRNKALKDQQAALENYTEVDNRVSLHEKISGVVSDTLQAMDSASDVDVESKGDIESPEIKASDCADWYGRGYKKSGVYTIWPKSRVTVNKSLDVYCDMDTDGGGWTVIQRRGNFGNPNDFFDKNWSSYKAGFGDIEKEFWLGNDNIFALTNHKLCTIRFDMQNKTLNKGYAKYSVFWIDDEFQKYKLHISNYSGNVADGMASHNNKNFIAKDSSKDENCASRHKGGWWYHECCNDCYRVNLNGLNIPNYGIRWTVWQAGTESLTWVEIKIRPEKF